MENEGQATLEAALAKLANARERAADLKSLATEARAALEQATIYQRWQDAQEQARQAEAEATDIEIAVRDLAIHYWMITGEKKPASGVEIKIFQEIRYDAAKALEYAKASLPAALRLDTRTFEAVARTLVKAGAIKEQMPFIEVCEDPRAQISKTLPTE
jgi:hypothetical protein